MCKKKKEFWLNKQIERKGTKYSLYSLGNINCWIFLVITRESHKERERRERERERSGGGKDFDICWTHQNRKKSKSIKEVEEALDAVSSRRRRRRLCLLALRYSWSQISVSSFPDLTFCEFDYQFCFAVFAFDQIGSGFRWFDPD